MDMTEKRKQVSEQCQVVAHLAKAINQIYSDYTIIFKHDGAMCGLEEIIGERTVCLMDELGDILNGHDAVTAEDEWVFPIMKRAREVFPEKECPTCGKPIPHNNNVTTMGKRYHFECVPKAA